MLRDKRDKQPLTRDEAFHIADDLATYFEDEEIGGVMALVNALTYEMDFNKREQLSLEIERAMAPYSRACSDTIDKLARKSVRDARKRM